MENYTLNFIVDAMIIWFGLGVLASVMLTGILIADGYKFTWKVIKEVLIIKIVWGPYYLYRVLEGWFMGDEKESKK